MATTRILLLALMVPCLTARWSPTCASGRASSSATVRYGGTFHQPLLLENLSSSTYDLLLRGEMIHRDASPPVHRVQVGLETLLRHKNWRKRKAAIEDLLWHPSERVERGLIDALRDPVLAVRETAAIALGKVGTNQSLVPLMDAMSFSPGPIRDSIAESLRQLTGEDYGRRLDRWRNWREANRGALR